MRLSTAIRAAAGAALVAGIAAPLARRRLKLAPPVVTGTAALAPLALCVLVPRSRARDVGTCVLQMWAYVATYEMPNDDPEALERRVKVAYPVRVDKTIGLGTTPTLRLQRALATPGSFRTWEKVLVWSHWLWFLFPHGPWPTCSSGARSTSRAGRRRSTRRSTSDSSATGPSRPLRRYAGPPGPDGGRPHARAAAHDGRIR